MDAGPQPPAPERRLLEPHPHHGLALGVEHVQQPLPIADFDQRQQRPLGERLRQRRAQRAVGQISRKQRPAGLGDLGAREHAIGGHILEDQPPVLPDRDATRLMESPVERVVVGALTRERATVADVEQLADGLAGVR